MRRFQNYMVVAVAGVWLSLAAIHTTSADPSTSAANESTPKAAASTPPNASHGNLVSNDEIRRWTTAVDGGSSGPQSEWTFERAQREWQRMVRPVQHVGIPGYEWETGVFWDGSLYFGPETRLEQAVAPLKDNPMHLCVAFGEQPRFIDRRGTNHSDISRSLEMGRLPIPSIETRDGDLTWTETVFAHLLDRAPSEGLSPRPDDLLVTHMRWKVTNRGTTRQTAHLWLYPMDTSRVRLGYKCEVDSDLGKSLGCRLESGLATNNDRVRFAIQPPAKGKLTQSDQPVTPKGSGGEFNGAISWQVPLAPGEAAELCVVVPYAHVTKETGDKLLLLDSQALFDEACSFWKGIIQRDGQITTPDPFFNDYLAAVAGQMTQQTVFHHYPSSGVWMYKTSPNHYESFWPCNEAKALPTFDFRGLSEINRKVLQSFVDMQTDDTRGLDRTHMGRGNQLAGEGYAKVKGFLGNFRDWTANPLLLSHGMGMWALAAHYRVTRDREWLGEGPGSPLQAMVDAFDWVSTQRRRTMREENGRKVDHWGMLPAASAHDWLAGSTIFNDAYCIYGMTEVTRLLHEIGHPRAAELQQELNAYRGDLQTVYSAARDRARPVPLADGRALPYIPRIVTELDWSKIDWTYTGYGPLRAGAWGVLDPHDPLVDQSLAFLEAGLPRGESPYYSPFNREIADVNFTSINSRDAERHHLWRHYVEYETMWPIGGPLFLARDDLPRYFEWLFNNMAIVLHHDWRVGVESLDGAPSCAPGDSERWQLVRRMFVNETGGWDGSQQDLFLLQAIPRCWLRPNDRLAVRKMKTYFGGQLDLVTETAADGASIQVTLDINLDVPPKKVRMRLRSGDGSPLTAATYDGTELKVLPGDIIELPTTISGAHKIVGSFKRN
jgi:hypothetical protein